MEPTSEELQQGYHSYLKRKEKQREYQKKYAGKKKKETDELQKEIDALNQQNSALMFYYYLFQVYHQQHPHLLDKFLTELSQQYLQPPEFHEMVQKIKPFHGNPATVKPKNMSPDPQVRPFVTPAIGPFVSLNE